MSAFYRDTAIGCLCLAILSVALVAGGVLKSHVSSSLFPERDGRFPWVQNIAPGSVTDDTRLSVYRNRDIIEYDFYLAPDAAFPYTHYALDFAAKGQPVDLTRFKQVRFTIGCDPHNVLLFVLFTFDDQVTRARAPETRRISSTAFACGQSPTEISLDFGDLKTPHWWLERQGLAYSDKGYRLDKALGFAFVNSLQSPADTPSRVQIADIALVGQAPGYLYAAGGASALLWLGFGALMLRRYVAETTERLRAQQRRNQPLLAYKALTIEPHRNRERDALLRYIATEYANPDLSLEQVASALGINRTKVNALLKEELALTFKAYLRKLRLTEAARLLSENADANISQIAYEVGFNNVSYFNTLFKAEYGCTPKTFQRLTLNDKHSVPC